MNTNGRAIPVGDVALALFMILFGALGYWGSLGLPEAVLEPVGPAVFPGVVSVVIAGFALCILAAGIFRPPPRRPPPDHRRRADLAIRMLALSVLYLLVMQFEWIAYREATVLYGTILTLALFDFQWRKLPMSLAISLTIGVGTQYIFTRWLYIDLP